VSNIKRFYIKIISLVSILCLVPVISFADDTSNSEEQVQTNFTIKPEFSESQVDKSNNYYDINLDPGQSENLKLVLKNLIDKEIELGVTVHTAFTNVNGVVEYGKDAKTPDSSLKYSIKDLVECPSTVKLGPNETRTIELKITMPNEKIEGILAGGVKVEEVNEESNNKENTKDNGISIENKFAYIVGIVASNERSTIEPIMDLVDVFPNQLNYRNVISAQIQNSAPTYVNNLKVEATIKKEGESKILYSEEKENMQMAPNSSFDFPISLNGNRFEPGTYTAHVKATSGENTWEWEKKFTIDKEIAKNYNKQDVTIDNSINWLLIGAILLILVLLILLICLYVKYNKNKNKKI